MAELAEPSTESLTSRVGPFFKTHSAIERLRMTTNIIAGARSSSKAKTGPAAPSFSNAADVWDDATIANLSAKKITHMTPDELVRVIRASRLPLLTAASDEHLESNGRKTL